MHVTTCGCFIRVFDPASQFTARCKASSSLAPGDEYPSPPAMACCVAAVGGCLDARTCAAAARHVYADQVGHGRKKFGRSIETFRRPCRTGAHHFHRHRSAVSNPSEFDTTARSSPVYSVSCLPGGLCCGECFRRRSWSWVAAFRSSSSSISRLPLLGNVQGRLG
eukprot:239752-Chlamydomonas_euryale.AAC.4